MRKGSKPLCSGKDSEKRPVHHVSEKMSFSLAVPKLISAFMELESSAVCIGTLTTPASPATDVAGVILDWEACCEEIAVEAVICESPFAVFDCLEAHIASML